MKIWEYLKTENDINEKEDQIHTFTDTPIKFETKDATKAKKSSHMT